MRNFLKKALAVAVCLTMLLSFAAFSAAAEQTPAENGVPDYSKVDLDLTRFSDIMVYSTLFDMIASPDRYVGKTLKVKGFIERKAASADTEEQFFLTVYDETSCCYIKVLILTNEASAPLKTTFEVVVCGVLDIYRENGANYCRLLNAMVQ